jgi:Spy/CpxP family protein refolding chaperone
MQRQHFLALAVAAGLLGYSAPAAAQGEDRPPAGVADSGRRMLDPVGRLLEQRNELKLTDEQASRLEAIRSKYLEKHRGKMEQLRRDREARAAFRADMDSTRTEVMAVLTPEQQKQVEAMREKARKEWREGRHGGWHRSGHGHGHGHGHDDGDDNKDDNDS